MRWKDAVKAAHETLLRAEKDRQDARDREAEFSRRLNGDLTDEEKAQVLEDFGRKLAASQISMPPEFGQILHDHFWELL